MDKKLDTILLLGAVGVTALYLFYLKPKLRQKKKEADEAKMQQSWQDVLDGKKSITDHNPNFSTVYSWQGGVPCFVPPCGLQQAFSNAPINPDFIKNLPKP